MNDVTHTQIRSIRIRKLFGWLDYDLPTEGSFGNVVILYGDNGSGKTTILNLIFHLLSPATNRGHRTAIKTIPFQYLEIVLSNGTIVSASRNDAQPGPVAFSIQKPGNESISWTFDDSPNVPKSLNLSPDDLQLLSTQVSDKLLAGRNFVLHSNPPWNINLGKSALLLEDSQDRFHEALKDLNVSFYFISSDRRIRSDDLPARSPSASKRAEEEQFRASDTVDTIAVARSTYLSQAMEAASRWISRRAFSETNTGSTSANQIYTNLVRTLARAYTSDSNVSLINKQELILELRALATRNEGYAIYEFAPPLHVEEIIANIEAATPETLPTIQQVLAPYINSVKARLDALTSTYDLVSRFIQNLNDFFSYKTISFSPTRGFQIVDRNGNPINTVQLSSGEQQLLLLFCHTLVSRDKKSLILIDEPEISLNIKWQRKLIDSLLQITHGSDTQFIFASHSIELLTQHMDAVARLDNLSESEDFVS